MKNHDNNFTFVHQIILFFLNISLQNKKQKRRKEYLYEGALFYLCNFIKSIAFSIIKSFPLSSSIAPV